MKHLIIGNCIAAAGAVEGIRSVDGQSEITVIDGEQRGSYTRPLITYYLAGQREAEHMLYRPAEFFIDHKVNVIPGRAVSIDPQARQVVLDNRQVLDYDRLLLATGASPVVPDLPGIGQSWVQTLYTWQDAEQVGEIIAPGETVLIMGSGLIGLKAAEALYKRGLKVIMVEKEPQILPRLLSAGSAAIVTRHLESQGIQVLAGREVTALADHRVELDDGRHIAAQLVIVAVGTRPNHVLAAECGLETGRGVIVDSALRTSDPFIYAAGDVIESRDLLTGRPEIMALLPHAHREGFLAGRNMAGQPSFYQGGIFINSVNLLGINIIAAGDPRAQGRALSYQQRQHYLELTVEDDCLRRYIALNMPEVTGPLTTVIEKGITASAAAWQDFINSPGLSKLPQSYWEDMRRWPEDGSLRCG